MTRTKQGRSRERRHPAKVHAGTRNLPAASVSRNRPRDPSKPILITGGAGFIGSNLAHRYLSNGQPVIIYDNLSRPGVELNLSWLQEMHGGLVEVEIADVLDQRALEGAVERAGQIFHLAAQVAVTTSLVEPVDDFETNARGTLNLLEVIRRSNAPPPLVYTSTNKVYGGMDDVKLACAGRRYGPVDAQTFENGFSERRPLEFRSPYGCSKGAADQYVLDYARTFGLDAVVFRMSCIYGPRQFGTEDQGWVAHFLIRAAEGLPITVYGDGKQVRDLLFVEDAIDAFLLAQEEMPSLRGEAFNLGGGPGNSVSLLELLDLIAELKGERQEVHFEAWRPADQHYYVSDVRKFSGLTGWKPQVPVADGIRQVYRWLLDSEEVFALNGHGPGTGFSRNGENHFELEKSSRNFTASRKHSRHRPAMKLETDAIA